MLTVSVTVVRVPSYTPATPGVATNVIVPFAFTDETLLNVSNVDPDFRYTTKDPFLRPLNP